MTIGPWYIKVSFILSSRSLSILTQVNRQNIFSSESSTWEVQFQEQIMLLMDFFDFRVVFKM